MYGAAELREACEQLIGAQRDSGNRLRLMGKQCAVVRLIYPPASVASVTFRDATGKLDALSSADEAPFPSVPMGLYKVVTYRFNAWPAQGALVTARRPLFIGTLYE